MDAATETLNTLRAKLDDLRYSNAPYGARVAVRNEIARMEREMGPTPPPRVMSRAEMKVRCCDRAVFSHKCTCAVVRTCPDHGVAHSGTHD